MPIYEVDIPGQGTFEVESDRELSDDEAYQEALSQGQGQYPGGMIPAPFGYGVKDPDDPRHEEEFRTGGLKKSAARIYKRLHESGETVKGIAELGRLTEDPIEYLGTMAGAAAAPFEPIFATIGEPVTTAAEEFGADPETARMIGTGAEFGAAVGLPFAPVGGRYAQAAEALGFGRVPAAEAGLARAQAALPAGQARHDIAADVFEAIKPTERGVPKGQPIYRRPGGPELTYAERLRRVTHEETARLSETLGMSVDELFPTYTPSPHELHSVLRQFDEIAKSVKASSAEFHQTRSPAALTRLMETTQRFSEVKTRIKGVEAELGRGLGEIRLSRRNMDRVSQFIADKLTRLEDPESIIRFLDGADDAVRTGQLGRGKFKKVLDGLHEAWINARLSGPKTHIVNTASNILTGLMRPFVQTPLAATVEAVRTLGGTRRARKVLYSESLADLAGMKKGLSEGVEAFVKSLATGEPIFGGGKLERVSTLADVGKRLGRTGKLAAAVTTSPGRALIAADEFFKAVNYRGRVNQLAYRKSIEMAKRGKIRHADIPRVQAELSRIKSTGRYRGVRKELQTAGIDEATYRTFQRKLGTGEGAWARAEGTLQSWRNLPGGRYIVPFLRTPVNIAKFGVEHTPLGFVGKTIKARKGAFKGRPELFAEEMARPVVGSLVGAGLMASWDDDPERRVVFGGGPTDPEERKTWYASGWLPYSIKVGDQYLQYNRFEPLGMVLGLMADYQELVKEGVVENEDAAFKVATAIGNNLTSKTFLRGISELLRALQDPDRLGGRYFARQITSIVPTFFQHIGFAADPILRRPEGIPAHMAAGGLGDPETVKPYRDIWGKPVVYQEATEDPLGAFMERFLSPVRRSRAVDDPSTLELKRLGYGPGSPRRHLGSGPNRVRMNERQYDRYTELGGYYSKINVDKLLSRSSYHRADDDEKRRLIKRAFTEGHSKARDELRREFTELPRETRRRLRRRRTGRRGR